MEDEITIKSGESRLVVERGKIARIVGSYERARRRSDRGAVSILDIRVLGDPILRQETTPVDGGHGRDPPLVADMFETMYHARGHRARRAAGRTHRAARRDRRRRQAARRHQSRDRRAQQREGRRRRRAASRFPTSTPTSSGRRTSSCARWTSRARRSRSRRRSCSRAASSTRSIISTASCSSTT